jgi:hypothetical protein
VTQQETRYGAAGVVLLIASIFLPNPVRGVLAIVLCLGLPAWAGATVVQKLFSEVAVRIGAGVAYSLVAWTLCSLALLEVGVAPSAGVAVGEGVIFTVVPFVVRRGVGVRQD